MLQDCRLFPKSIKTEFHWVHKANGDGTASEIPKTINRRKPWWSMTSATGTKSYMPPNPKNPRQSKGSIRLVSCKPHRLHLGIIGLELENEVRPSDVQNIQQSLDMWNGIINSRFTLKETPYHIQTVCHPERDMIAARLSARQPAGIKFHFPYPTGGHCDDACNWEANDKHSTTLVSKMHNRPC